MDDKHTEKVEDRLEYERRAYRRLLGALLFPVALFPLLSLMTYNWRDIAWLNSPPLSPPANLIGIVGAWAVFVGYSIFGLSMWLLPFLFLLFSAMLLYGKIARIGRRVAWTLLFLVALCCLIQLGSETVFEGVLEKLNQKPNAGGAIGYGLMTCLLARWFSPVGGGLLMLSIMFLALVMAIGLRNVFSGLGRLTGWWESRQSRDDDSEEGPSDADEKGDGLTLRERERQKRLELKEAAKRAKEEARRARTEERRRDDDARNEERRRKQEERAELERSQESARQRERDAAVSERSQAEIIRRRADEARQAAQAAHERVPAVSRDSVAVRKQASQSVVSEAIATAEQPPDLADYPLPPISLLNPVPQGRADHGNIAETAEILVETLRHFNVAVEVVGTTPGPVVTQYELRPAPNVKVERIANLTANLQMALEAASLRVQAPIPGKNAVGIEIPNRKARPVTFREVIEGEAWRTCEYEVPLLLGKDVAGNDLIFDLTKAPHLLVAGSTGSGKSVCLNAILNGFLMSRTPEQLRLILVDPKRVEFTCYNDLPHLLVPVINDAKKVAFGLRWAISEMEKRYRMFQKVHCRNLVAFNSRVIATQEELFGAAGSGVTPPGDDIPAKLPYIVIVVDEVADIMAAVGKEIEPAIHRLTSLSRAVGIHLILATQRPSVDVITGTIKSNIPGRIAFKVSQSNDSRTILDNPGAEELIGKGDMLFLKEGSTLMRAQGAWVGDDEIGRVVAFVKEHCRPCYDQALIGRLDKIKESDPDAAMADDDDDESESGEKSSGEGAEVDDELLPNAMDVIRMTRRASTTMLQRRLRIGYTRAARLMDILEERGVVGPQMGSGTREILVDLDNQIPGHSGFVGGEDETPLGVEENETDAEDQV
jgi:S-DNA-T family DNA segregation ATPase FtsK/SpoIIIE